jgi:rod shape-determining protein MreD
MSDTVIGRIFLFLLLVALQTALFDRIHLFGCATPLLYIYFIIKLPGSMNRNAVLLLAAGLGLCVDLLSHTSGMNMLACVVVGFGRYFLLDWFIPRDLNIEYAPSFRSLGMPVFLRYALVVTLLHHAVLFSAESFSLFDPLSLILRIAGSLILTMLLIFAFENLRFI